MQLWCSTASQGCCSQIHRYGGPRPLLSPVGLGQPLPTPGRLAPHHVLHSYSLQEFLQLAKRLVAEPAWEKELVANGKAYVDRCHSWQGEQDTYQHLVQRLQEA